MLKRVGFMLARPHAELNTEPPNLGLIRGLVAQFVKIITQAALDHGAIDMAMTTWPEADPVRPSDRDPVPPPVEQADPFAGLVSAEELSAGMAYLKDLANLARARGERVNRRHGDREAGSGAGGNASRSQSSGGGGWTTGSSGREPGAGRAPRPRRRGTARRRKEAAAAARRARVRGRASRGGACPGTECRRRARMATSCAGCGVSRDAGPRRCAASGGPTSVPAACVMARWAARLCRATGAGAPARAPLRT